MFNRKLLFQKNLILEGTWVCRSLWGAPAGARLSGARRTSAPRSFRPSMERLGLASRGPHNPVWPQATAPPGGWIGCRVAKRRLHGSATSTGHDGSAETSTDAGPRGPEGITEDLFWVGSLFKDAEGIVPTLFSLYGCIFGKSHLYLCKRKYDGSYCFPF